MSGFYTIDEDNNVYIFWSNRVYLDEYGNEVWVIDNAEGIYYPSWHPDGFLLCNGNALYAFDPADGSILWGPVLYDYDQDPSDKPIIDAEGYIYTFSEDTYIYLYCINSSGEIVFSYRMVDPTGTDWYYGPLEHLIIAPNGNLYFIARGHESGPYLECLTASGAWVNDTNFAAEVNDDGSVSLSWTDTPEWPFHSYVVDRVIKEDHYAGVHPVHELPLPADGGPYELLDTDLEPGRTWEYTLKAVRGDGITHPYGPIEVTIPDPRGVAVQLHQPYPNPAVNTITLEYELPSGTNTATITVYDLAGRGITTRDLDPTPGRHCLILPTDSYPPGVYIARLAGEGASESRRFVISR